MNYFIFLNKIIPCWASAKYMAFHRQSQRSVVWHNQLPGWRSDRIGRACPSPSLGGAQSLSHSRPRYLHPGGSGSGSRSLKVKQSNMSTLKAILNRTPSVIKLNSNFTISFLEQINSVIVVKTSQTGSFETIAYSCSYDNSM